MIHESKFLQEGLGESPLNRSQEGTYSSSRRSSQEDIRWPSSETRPWSSTDSDSSGRPKLGSSFETDVSNYYLLYKKWSFIWVNFLFHTVL